MNRRNYILSLIGLGSIGSVTLMNKSYTSAEAQINKFTIPENGRLLTEDGEFNSLIVDLDTKIKTFNFPSEEKINININSIVNDKNVNIYNEDVYLDSEGEYNDIISIDLLKNDDISIDDFNIPDDGELEKTDIDLEVELKNEDIIESTKSSESFFIELGAGLDELDIEIENPNSTVLKNFQTLINLNHTSIMESDFSNLEFYQEDSELSYWIEDYVEDESAKIWVNVNELYEDSITNIKVRFGSGISNKSDGKTVFNHFDDFSSDSSDDWTDEHLLYNRGSGNRFIWNTSDEQLETDESNSDWHNIYIDTKDDEELENNGFISEISTKTDDDDGMGIGFIPKSDSEYELYASMTSNDYEGAGNNNYESLVGWTENEYTDTDTTATEIIDYGQVIGGSTGSSYDNFKIVTMEYDGDNIIKTGYEREMQNEVYEESGLELDSIGLVSAANDPKAYYDWFIVRKRANEKPQVTVKYD